MIRRQFIKMIGALSVLGFVFKGQTQEIIMPEQRVSSDLAPTVPPEAVVQFQRFNTLSSAPLLSGPLCGNNLIGIQK